MFRSLLVVLVAIVSFNAHAQEAKPEEPAHTTFAMNVGGLGLILPEGQWIGGYVYFGPSAMIPVSGCFSLIPGFSFEAAPGAGNWGFVGQLLADFSVADWLAIDVGVFLTHDEDPALAIERGRATTGYISFAAGPTFIFKNGMTASIMAQVNVNLEGLGYSLSPVVNVSVPLPF